MVKPMSAIQEYRPRYSTPAKDDQRWNSKVFSRSFTDSSEFKEWSTQDLRRAHQELINELTTLKRHEQEIRQTNMARSLPKAACAVDIKRIAARRAFLARLANDVLLVLREHKDKERKSAMIAYRDFFMQACEEALPKELCDRLHELARAKCSAQNGLEEASW